MLLIKWEINTSSSEVNKKEPKFWIAEILPTFFASFPAQSFALVNFLVAISDRPIPHSLWSVCVWSYLTADELHLFLPVLPQASEY